ncbi:MAG: DUF2550 domain-containing protein [Micromonosporaceae bacterium]
MRAFEAAGVAASLLLAVLLAVFVRRELILRGGTIDMSVRLNTLVKQRGWAPGLGRFVGDELRWYRVFSLGLRPRHVLSRHGLRIADRRAPHGEERLVMAEDWIVVRCDRAGERVDIAFSETTFTGFVSWLESAPPGALRPYA